MKLSIIIVSWNVREQLRTCLDSLQAYLPIASSPSEVEIWVVDNASADGSADMVEQDFPEVNLIRNLENKGFGTANNQALEYATGEYVLFLNDDTYITENILPILDIFTQAEYSKVGMIGGQLRNVDGSIQASVRRFPTLLDQLLIACKLHTLITRPIKRYTAEDFDYTHEARVDQVMGAFMFMPRAVLHEVGAFDQDFFTWFEEVDLQKRLHTAGYEVLYTPKVTCVHVGGASFSQLRKAKAQWMFMNSMATYFYKQHGYTSYAIIRIIQPISVLLAYVYQTILALASRTR